MNSIFPRVRWRQRLPPRFSSQKARAGKPQSASWGLVAATIARGENGTLFDPQSSGDESRALASA
ncbi:hypothetical protein LJR245_004818 [Rhizobium leguminosarum]|uniref:Uncharacterized protein n=1 Tax=Rhizobium ruizarguesonis TaxID=2081791 RepID=A0ACD5EPE2_9HYPH